MVYLNWNYVKKYSAKKCYLPKGIIKNYNINGKNFYDQPIDSDIKPYEEIRSKSNSGNRISWAIKKYW